MTEIEKIDAIEKKYQIINKRSRRCEVCGFAHPALQLAHRIPKTKYNLETYGKKVIHHPLNLVVTCPGACNDSVLMNFASQPIEARKLVERIKTAIKTGVMW